MATDTDAILSNLCSFYDMRDKSVIHVGAGGGQLIGYAFNARSVLAVDPDRIAVSRLETAIQQLNETGSTILFSSHHMSDVERVAGRVVMLHDGRVLIDNELDELREAFSLALVPHDAGVDRLGLEAMDACLAVREREDALHAILRYAPDEARAMLEREFDVTRARCESIPLEEMFIELVGGRS